MLFHNLDINPCSKAGVFKVFEGWPLKLSYRRKRVSLRAILGSVVAINRHWIVVILDQEGFKAFKYSLIWCSVWIGFKLLRLIPTDDPYIFRSVGVGGSWFNFYPHMKIFSCLRYYWRSIFVFNTTVGLMFLYLHELWYLLGRARFE